MLVFLCVTLRLFALVAISFTHWSNPFCQSPFIFIIFSVTLSCISFLNSISFSESVSESRGISMFLQVGFYVGIFYPGGPEKIRGHNCRERHHESETRQKFRRKLVGSLNEESTYADASSHPTDPCCRNSPPHGPPVSYFCHTICGVKRNRWGGDGQHQLVTEKCFDAHGA